MVSQCLPRTAPRLAKSETCLKVLVMRFNRLVVLFITMVWVWIAGRTSGCRRVCSVLTSHVGLFIGITPRCPTISNDPMPAMILFGMLGRTSTICGHQTALSHLPAARGSRRQRPGGGSIHDLCPVCSNPKGYTAFLVSTLLPPPNRYIDRLD